MRRRRGQTGQAAVESALVLPLALFMVLGAIQLFLMHQARIMAEYAAFRATRAGSVNHGDCEAMNHAALAAVLPTLRKTTTPRELGQAFQAVKDNTFGDSYSTTTQNIADEQVVWICREAPLMETVPLDEDRAFDARFDNPMQLQVRLIYWYPMRIPFADWVIYRTAAASLGVAAYAEQNPLMLTQRANWEARSNDTLTSDVHSRMRSNLGARRYLFPIQASSSVRPP